MKQKTKFKETEIGKIPEGWKEAIIGDFIDIKHGFAFKGEFFTDDPNGNILLTPGNFKIGGGFKSDKFKYTKEEPPKDYILNEGDIIVTMTDLSKKGDTLGYSAKIPKSDKLKFLHNQRVGLIILKENNTDKDFIYWVLRNRRYNDFIVGSSTGSTVRHTSPSRIKEYDFFLPPLPEQKSIAKILSSLDTKIELNNKICGKIEKVGKTLFNKWLVNLEEIPDKWETKPLDKIAEFLNGLALQKYPAKEGEDYLPVIKIRELRNGLTEQTDKANFDLPEEYILKDGDVLFSWSGSLEVEIWTHGQGALNQHLFKVTSNEFPKWFYYFWTKNYLQEFRHIAAGKATTMGHIQRHNLSQSDVLVPDKKSLDEMNKIMEPLLEQYISLRLESNKLSKIRDLILPKLMNGEIRTK